MAQFVGRYVYWSQRLVTEVIEDNGIRLTLRVKPALNLGLAGSGVNLTGRDRANTIFDIAEKLKRRLRRSIITDFATATAGRLVRGAGHAEVAEFQPNGHTQHRFQQRTAVIHTQAATQDGRVDLCLFGSLENLKGFTVPVNELVDGWTSSAAPMIEELITLRGGEASSRTGPYLLLDDEELAVETLRVALLQGIHGNPADHHGHPETRAYTLLGFDATEYVALIYRDVTLTPGRWDHEDEIAGAHRILIGAPLWMRTTRQNTIRRYYGEHRMMVPHLINRPRKPDLPPEGQIPSSLGDAPHTRDDSHTQD